MEVTTICLYDYTTGKKMANLSHDEDPITRFSFNPTGDLVATTSDSNFGLCFYYACPSEHCVKVWTPDGTPITTLKMENPSDVLFDPTGTRLLTVSGKLQLFDAKKGTRIASYTEKAQWPRRARYSPNGKTIVVDHRTSITVLDAQNLKLITTFEVCPSNSKGDYIHLWEFTPDSRYIVTSTGSGEIKRWSILDGTVKPFNYDEEQEAISLAFAPNGHICIIGFVDFALIYNLKSDRCIKRVRLQTKDSFLLDHRSYVFSPKDDIMAIYGANRENVTFYDTESWECICRLEKPYSCVKFDWKLEELTTIESSNNPSILVVRHWNLQKFLQAYRTLKQLTLVQAILIIQLYSNSDFDLESYPHLKEHYEQLGDLAELFQKQVDEKTNNDNEC